MSKYNVGDRVMVKKIKEPLSIMTDNMVRRFGGKVGTIQFVGRFDPMNQCNYYNIDIDHQRYFYSDYDLELVEPSSHHAQRIEIPVPGGCLVAETTGGEDYPAIHIFFISSGDEVEHDLCFAEVCAEKNPDVIRVGTYYADFEDVKDVFEYPMDVWRKEDEALDR